MSDGPDLIDCRKHGPSIPAVVCSHLIGAKTIVGFVENSSDVEDRQAWCDACETMFSREGSLTEAFRKFNDFAVVCGECYEAIKANQSVKRPS